MEKHIDGMRYLNIFVPSGNVLGVYTYGRGKHVSVFTSANKP